MTEKRPMITFDPSDSDTESVRIVVADGNKENSMLFVVRKVHLLMAVNGCRLATTGITRKQAEEILSKKANA